MSHNPDERRKEMSLPRVSIIVLTWNQLELTAACLESLRKVRYPAFEVVVVDNGSSDGSAVALQRRYPEAKFVLNPRNEGYAGGNNRGMEKASGDYFLLLNNDTEVDPDFLNPLVEIAEKDPLVGAASPKILYYDFPERAQYEGFTAINPLTGRNRASRVRANTGEQTYETASAHGAAMLVRREAVERVGLLFEGFFMYYEEIDWCYRMKRKGYKSMFVGKSRIYHKVSQTFGKESPRRCKLLSRKRIIFMRRNTKGPQQAIFWSYLFFITIPFHALSLFLKGERELLRAYLEGVWEGLFFSPTQRNYFLSSRGRPA